MQKLDYKTYLDKVLACWTGKSLGGIIGAPYECHKQFKQTEINDLWPKILYPNDDLDIQVVYLEAMQEHGLFIDSESQDIGRRIVSTYAANTGFLSTMLNMGSCRHIPDCGWTAGKMISGISRN